MMVTGSSTRPSKSTRALQATEPDWYKIFLVSIVVVGFNVPAGTGPAGDGVKKWQGVIYYLQIVVVDGAEVVDAGEVVLGAGASAQLLVVLELHQVV